MYWAFGEGGCSLAVAVVERFHLLDMHQIFGEGFWRGVLERGSWRGVLGEGFLERVLGKLFSFTWDGVGRARIRDDEFWQELEFLICCFASREWEFEIDIRRR